MAVKGKIAYSQVGIKKKKDVTNKFKQHFFFFHIKLFYTFPVNLEIQFYIPMLFKIAAIILLPLVRGFNGDGWMFSVLLPSKWLYIIWVLEKQYAVKSPPLPFCQVWISWLKWTCRSRFRSHSSRAQKWKRWIETFHPTQTTYKIFIYA